MFLTERYLVDFFFELSAYPISEQAWINIDTTLICRFYWCCYLDENCFIDNICSEDQPIEHDLHLLISQNK